jgi:hypothetical protein
MICERCGLNRELYWVKQGNKFSRVCMFCNDTNLLHLDIQQELNSSKDLKKSYKAGGTQ